MCMCFTKKKTGLRNNNNNRNSSHQTVTNLIIENYIQGKDKKRVRNEKEYNSLYDISIASYIVLYRVRQFMVGMTGIALLESLLYQV